MLRPIALAIGLRYTRAKRRNHFISFISLASTLGIALGVMVLITVMSVMNGFDQAIRERVFGMASHVTIFKPGGLKNWNQLAKRVEQAPGIEGVAPFVAGQGMLNAGGLVHGAMVNGILPQRENNVSVLSQKMIEGKLASLKPGRFNVVIGRRLADKLGVDLGDKILLITPDLNRSITGVTPRMRNLTVSGVYEIGNGFGFDSGYAFIHLQDAQRLYRLGSGITGLRTRIHDIYRAPHIAMQLAMKLPEKLDITNWTLQFGSLFKAVAMEKTMMFLMLVLIIAVAAFNLVSSLVMLVNDKQSDIAILRTLGATPGMILRVFMIQGMALGLLGTGFGLLSGVALARHVTGIFDWLQRVLHLQLLSSNVYYLDYLPSRLEGQDVVIICLLALVMSLLATLYPAWRASRVQPAEALRYE